MAADWDKIKTEYISGGITLRELAEKNHISQSTIRQKAAKEKWKEEKNNVRTTVEQKVQKRVVEKRSKDLMKGIDVIKYTADVLSDAMRDLTVIISQTPEYMLANPAVLTSVSNSMDKTYELMRKMCGITEAQKKLQLEREKLELERKKFETELKAREQAENGGVQFVFEPPEGVKFE